MTIVKRSSASLLVVAVLMLAAPATPAFAQSGRQYYDTSWSYNQNYGYYYRTYYFQTTVTQTTYDYHYCIYYPAQPTYIYYYNPEKQYYWGRYEVGSTGDKRYSKLKEEDRKKDLKDIPNDKFPEADKMPSIPGAEDKVAIDPPPDTDLPKKKD
jgi:hypothetical protein